MANRQTTFLLKRSNVPGKIPPSSGLTSGELALNTADAILYTSGSTANQILPIGWDRIHRTGDTVFGDFAISGSSLPSGYALSVTGDTNLVGDVYVEGDLNYDGNLIVSGGTIVESGFTANTIYTDYIDFNTNATVASSNGRIYWDSGTGTLNVSVGDTGTGLIDLQVGQEEIVRVYNDEATTLVKGEIVYVSGSQGNRPAVKRALATGDGYSVTTLGMVDRDILSGSEGYVTTFGIISNLNTLGLTGGTAIWLSGTIPGGYTSVKPIAPLHTVLIGYVVRVSATVGSVFVNISNGWELDELHDVRISAATEGDLLMRSSFSGTPLWVNTKTLNGSYTITGNTNIGGNLVVSGNTTLQSITGTTLEISGNTSSDLVKITQTGSGNAFVVEDITRPDSTPFVIDASGNTGIGTTTPVAKLDVRAQGTTSGDTVFRVRNSGDTANLMQVAGDNTMTFLSTAGNIGFRSNDAGGNITLKRNFNSQTMIELAGGDNAFIKVTPINVASYIGFGSFTDYHAMYWDGVNFHFQNKNTFHNVFDVVCNSNNATSTFRLGSIASNTNFFNLYGPNDAGTGINATQLFNVNTNGNVGIGVTGTTAKLHINNTTSGNTFLAEDNTNPDSTPFIIDASGNTGIGTLTPQAKLDVRAQGTSTSDIAFRVRNSGNTGNIFTTLGSNQFIFGTSTTTPEGNILLRHDFGSAQPALTIRNGEFGNLIFQIRDERTASSSTVGNFRMNGMIIGGETGLTRRFDLGGYGLGATHGDNSANMVWENNQGNIGDGQGTSVISVSSNFYINQQTTKRYKFEATNGNFGISQMSFGTSATNTFAIANGTAPTTSPTDAYQQYSADIVAGNAAPHFRTENGGIIKLYQNANTVAIDDVLVNTGLRASGGTSNFTNAITTTGLTVNGNLTVTGNTSLRSFTGTSATISGSGQSILTVIGSGNSTTSPIFSVQGSSGELFSVSDSLTGSLFSVNDISGLPIVEVFSDNTTLMGSYQAPSLNTTTRTSLSAGTNTIYSIPTSAYTGAFFEYTLISTGSTGARAGQIMSIWSGSTAQFTETSTLDIGTTAGVTFSVAVSGNNAVLSSSATTAGWTVKTIIRSI